MISGNPSELHETSYCGTSESQSMRWKNGETTHKSRSLIYLLHHYDLTYNKS